MTRPTLDDTLLEVAHVMARRGTCSRLQVGAVLARDTRIIATGYNGAPAGQPHCHHDGLEQRCTIAIHAERNVIGYAARVGAATGGSTLYVTHAPCPDCASVVLAAGIVRVVYGTPYGTRDGAARLRECGVLVEHHPGPAESPGIALARHEEESDMAEQVPDEPILAEYEQYIREQVAAKPLSTYARGIVRDLLAEVDRLRAIERRAHESPGGVAVRLRAVAHLLADSGPYLGQNKEVAALSRLADCIEADPDDAESLAIARALTGEVPR